MKRFRNIAVVVCGLMLASALLASIEGGGFKTRGSITRFGSVIVNGVQFDTAASVITDDGATVSITDLRVGQVVTVDGVINADLVTGVANFVSFESVLRGPISDIDLVNRRLTVLGQTIVVDDATAFAGSILSLSLLTVGDSIEVSGIANVNGQIVATFIDIDNTSEFRVSGDVANLSVTARQFSLGTIQVDFDSALLEGVLVNGALVRVESFGFNTLGVLVASEIKVLNRELEGIEGDQLGVEGFVSDFVSTTDFVVDGRRIVTDSLTVFSNGSALDIIANTRVQVDGVLDAFDNLVAARVDFRDTPNSRIAGSISSLDHIAHDLIVNGVSAHVGAEARLEDDSEADLDDFAFSDLSVGDYVELRGFEQPRGTNRLLVTRLDRADLEPEDGIRGFVAAISNPSLQVLGVTLVTDGNTKFEDDNGDSMSASEFFAQALGAGVKAEGIFDGQVLRVSEIELR